MTQERLNALAILSIEQEVVDELDFADLIKNLFHTESKMNVFVMHLMVSSRTEVW